MKTNIRLWMYKLNGTVWYPFCLVWSSISCFRDENVSHKSPMCIGGKITTVPRLFSEHLVQDENKHQIMNVQTKWNCLIPILLVWSSISCFREENVSHKSPMCISGKITTVPRLFSEHTYSKMKTNIRLWMYKLNGTVWYLFCLVWSSISCFRGENVSHKSPMCIAKW